MSAVAQAAVERIARVVQALPGDGGAGSPLTAAGLAQQALDANLAKLCQEQEEGFWMLGPEDDERLVRRFISFAGLVELGVYSGFADLRGWDGASILEQAVRQLRAANAGTTLVDLDLVDRLIGRYGPPPSGSWSLDSDTLGIFESYLTLTDRLERDRAVMDFLKAVDAPAPGDLSALVSPGHFAEAFATGSVDGVVVTDVSAGYRLLEYMEWLAGILSSLRDDATLRGGIVRHATWTERAVRQRPRLSVWVERMREWDQGRSPWTDETWRSYTERTFGAVEAELERRHAADRAAAGLPEANEAPTDPGPPSAPVKSIDRLLAEGRTVAARAAARSAALTAAKVPPLLEVASTHWYAWAQELVSTCKVLADLGGESAAAAILAPFADSLFAGYGSGTVVDDVQRLLARVKQPGHWQTPAPPAMEELQTPEEPARQVTRPETPPLRTRSRGQSS
jgi:hypothetical protein